MNGLPGSDWQRDPQAQSKEIVMAFMEVQGKT